MEIITTLVAALVGLVVYKERAINLITISAAWLGSFLLFLLFVNHGKPLLPSVVWICLGATIFALIVLCKRFPMFLFFMICLISGLVGGRRGYYYPYWRRWW
jgi:hypothetical protein